MPAAIIFQIQLALGYLPWLLLFVTYLWPRLRAMDPVAAHRLIATLHSFRFFGLVFLVPGVVGPGLPPGFAASAAYGDLAAGLLAMLALFSVRVRPLFMMFVVAFNVVGAADLILNYVHGVRLDLPGAAGALGAAYWIPILYVPILMITHVAALRLLLLRRISPEAQTA
ncbi:hypothetical protein ASD45_11075 [Pseudolabrys sp. Root1462]|uniref:hypothetical protein n=1 Tax=Pseudolabrys sp. Root1462 TaxID=1736466 RepID=UPI000703ADDE|nr:hypothetical protein [Pseudolabrys sp. Root1462]KQZ01332.1 hypothetical protein ASD45_11075 [Pseudolabrys sp. Root1462]